MDQRLSVCLFAKPFVKCLVEVTRTLSKAVKGFAQKEYHVGWDAATFRRSKVDCCFKIAVEKRCLDIHVVAFHVEMIGTDRVFVCNRSKQLVKVDSSNLREPFSNPARFISRRFAGFPINLSSVHPASCRCRNLAISSVTRSCATRR